MKRMNIGWLTVCVLAAIFLAYSLYSATHSNFNFGLAIIYFLAAAFSLWTVLFSAINHFLGTLPGKILLGILLVGVALAAGILAFVLISAHSALPNGKERAVIVLGAGLRGNVPSLLLQYRLDAAYEYYLENPDAIIVTTGGQGRGETCPEGRAMKAYLVQKGVPESCILAEEKSTSTEENFAFSAELLEEKGIARDAAVVLVTNGFHCYRARQYAAMAGYTEVASIPAQTPATAILPCYLREVAAVCYYWMFKSSRTGFLHPLVGILAVNKRFFYH